MNEENVYSETIALQVSKLLVSNLTSLKVWKTRTADSCNGPVDRINEYKSMFPSDEEFYKRMKRIQILFALGVKTFIIWEEWKFCL